MIFKKFNVNFLIVFFILIYSAASARGYFKRFSVWKEFLLSEQKKEEDWLKASDWILENSDINDVFAASPDRAYFYVTGRTGRKTVAIGGSHASAYVNQEERMKDLNEIYTTRDEEKFRELAGKYDLKFAVVSPYEEWYFGGSRNEFVKEKGEVFSVGEIKIYKI